MTAEEWLPTVLPGVRRYAAAPNSLFAVPSTLSAICRVLGFKNPCRAGHVYITPTKIRYLEKHGLAAPLPGNRPCDEAGGARQ